MKNICVIYGSSTGTCQGLAEKIGQQLGVQDDGIIDVQNLTADVVNKYDVLILGTSTWGAGEMQGTIGTTVLRYSSRQACRARL